MRQISKFIFNAVIVVLIIYVTFIYGVRYLNMSTGDKIGAAALTAGIFAALGLLIYVLRRQQRKIVMKTRSENEQSYFIKPTKDGPPALLTKNAGVLTFYQMRGQVLKHAATFEAKDFRLEKVSIKTGVLRRAHDALRIIDMKDPNTSHFDFFVLRDNLGIMLQFVENTELDTVIIKLKG